jgi:A/G-specific adenine glycosylase
MNTDKTKSCEGARNTQFRHALSLWFARNGRDLPWRRTRDPYAVLVSEFMLQQTQVATVIPYYYRWLQRFPNFAELAAASENDVLHAWQGLGYYARARNLHTSAKAVQDRHRGKFPRDLDAIRALPGVGPYTANAVATFAFNQAVPIVEANTARVLARLFDYHEPIDSSRGRKALWKRAASLIPTNSAGIYNSALMDLGALVCLSRPRCTACPVQKFCRAKDPAVLPCRKSRPPRTRLSEDHAFVLQDGKILLEQASTRWRGMWILPRANPNGDRAIYRGTFPFTRHHVILQIFSKRSRRIDSRNQCWIPIGELDSLPIPSPHRRAIVDLLGARRAKSK